MKLSDIEADIKRHNSAVEYQGGCHDCGIPVSVIASLTDEGEITIEGGAIYKVKQNLEYVYFFKCDECFATDRILHDFEVCEVYSRAVGYLRPVKQWNVGKKAEFKMRKLFKNTEGR